MKKLAYASLVLFSTSAFAHNLPANTTWQSDYVVGKGTYSLQVTSKVNVSITENLNGCFFNYLGRVEGCTLMATTSTKGRLVVKPVATDHMTTLYFLENSNYEVVHNLGEEANGYIRLLRIDQNGQVEDSVRLFKK
ncbi:hypothetical protein [Silvanigrella aquatica]|uniref:DUF306 domain-containing protein n=1 Tax=Silvanigrella aquatica TaxID=1915309 RepID=A0A1L4D1H2_9BACT|nr:hypothetical protein [Silvanigrella aquatica]APJ04053.1 hypothetical protein AXG55_09095 [Silvanigrella aquatica]